MLCRNMLNSMVKSFFKISNNERNMSFLIGDQYRPTNSSHSINDLQNTRITPQKQERGNNFRSAVIDMTWGSCTKKASCCSGAPSGRGAKLIPQYWGKTKNRPIVRCRHAADKRYAEFNAKSILITKLIEPH